MHLENKIKQNKTTKTPKQNQKTTANNGTKPDQNQQKNQLNPPKHIEEWLEYV